MIALIKPTRIAIYLNPDGKTMKTVKDETGCDYIINGGLFEGLTRHCPLLKKDGYWYTARPWNAWGMAWNNADDCALLNVSDTRQNFISCVDLVNPWTGATGKLSYPSDMGGSRQRTAWGITEDGKHLLYVDQSGHTPEQLRAELCKTVKLKSLLMLDGGGSTQGIFKDKALTASRRVANFICFWTDDTDHFRDITEKEETMATLKKGNSGSAVKELQTRLNAFGFGLAVDGNFGGGTENAAKVFQACTGLTADGIAGVNTQTMLAMAEKMISTTETAADKLISYAFSQLCAAEPNGDDKYIKAFNSVTGAGFATSVSWCQIFAWFCLYYYGITCPVTASCTAARKEWQSMSKWQSKTYKPSKGDLIYYDWDSSGDCDHVGIVYDCDSQYVYAIEGNSTTAVGDAVALKKHDRGAAYIAGYATPFAAGTSAKPDVRDYIVRFTKTEAEALAKVYGGEVVRA